ncbi:MAG: DNA polymerase/3'-5' exonuclease PolX, partial [Thaumarchaeota archaeon]|nr:DNA polymerase/3'-5' exonuclease PolX [Nitrososphaerota archaeon]
LPSLVRVEGIGPKTVKLLYEQLKIRNIDELESAVKEGRLRAFKGLGVKSDQLLLERIESAKLYSNRMLLAQALNVAERITNYIQGAPGVKRFSVAGSLRRMKETIGDIDVLIEADDPSESIEYFTKEPEVRDVLAAGDTKASVRLESNVQVDARVIQEKSWGAALLYFTGSKAHNIELRTVAIRQHMHLSEYGLFREDETLVAGSSEEEVYKALGLDYIEPELRENKGEIQAAQQHRLPNLVRLEDIRGDLQMHTTWSDGREELATIVESSRALGYEYIAITDHIGSLKVANALDEKRIKDQRKEIDLLNQKYEKQGIAFHVLQGAEVNIKADGRLDMRDSVLKDFDVVLASIHSGLSEPSEKMTMRLLSAIENENVDIIAHPTGRLLLERSAYKVDFEKIFDRAISTETVLEIDAHTSRLDLNDENAHEALKAGCTLVIDTDAHESLELNYMKLGVAQARRAWATKKDILNTKNFRELSKFLEI